MTYSGVFTLLPLQTGRYCAHHGEILPSAADLALSVELRPIVNETRFKSKDMTLRS